MSCENRHAAVAIIDGHVAKAKTNEENSCPWRIENVLEVLKYVALNEQLQIWGCYHTSKIDPSVFVELELEKTVAIEIVSQETLNAFRWNPKIHMDAIRRETIRGNNGSFLGPCGGASCKTANAFFSHITYFVSQRPSVITRGHQFLEPGAFLNVEITDEQRYLLQPTAADILVCNLLKDSLGQNAKKKIPSQCINFISGNVASYSQELNNSEALKHIEDANMLSACTCMISESRKLAKDAAKEKKSQEAKSKEEKRLMIEQNLKRRRESCMRSMCGTCWSLWRLQVPSQRLSQKISY